VAPTLVYEQHNGRIEWHNNEKDILVFTLTDLFTWDEAIALMELMNETMLARQPTLVDSVYYFEKRNMPLPNTSMLRNLVRIMKMTCPNERLIVVANHTSIRGIIQAASVAYGILAITSDYRYADTLPEAITIIENYRVTLT